MYTQLDRTGEQIEHDELVTSPAYQAGIDMGWRLAEAYHMVGSGDIAERTDSRP